MGDPLISVIIPNFNKGKFLFNCINSVLSQTFENFEIIIVDNFSNDNSLQILESFSDSRINLISFSNQGIIAASRNIGIKNSKGKYLAFLDSDDYWTPNKLGEVYSILDEGADIVYHDFFRYTSKSSKTNKIIKSRFLKKPITKDLIINGNPIINSSVVVNKDLFISNNCFSEDVDLVTAEDADAWIRFSQITDKFFYLPKALGYLYEGEFNTSNSNIKKIISSQKLIIIYSEQIYKSSSKPNYLYCRIILSLFKLGSYKLVIKNLSKIDFNNLKLNLIIKLFFVFLISLILFPFSRSYDLKN